MNMICFWQHWASLLLTAMHRYDPSITTSPLVSYHVFEGIIIHSLANSPLFGIINHLTSHTQLSIPRDVRTIPSNPLCFFNTLPRTTHSHFLYRVASTLSTPHRSGNPTNLTARSPWDFLLIDTINPFFNAYLSLVVIINSLL